MVRKKQAEASSPVGSKIQCFSGIWWKRFDCGLSGAREIDITVNKVSVTHYWLWLPPKGDAGRYRKDQLNRPDDHGGPTFNTQSF